MNIWKPVIGLLFPILVAGCTAHPGSDKSVDADILSSAYVELRQGLYAYRQDNYDEALTWYRKAANKGLAEAQNRLGELYQGYPGVPQDLPKAVKWYRLAAGQGHIKAIRHLSLMYEMGRGVPKDFNEALNWLWLAAYAYGDADSQFRLGNIYQWGQGVSKDIDEATKWYALAAAQGHMNAKVAIECFTSTSRECQYLK